LTFSELAAELREDHHDYVVRPADALESVRNAETASKA